MVGNTDAYLCRIDESLKNLVKIAGYEEKTLVITIPVDGSTRTFEIGTTKIDFKNGQIINPDGSVETLSINLKSRGREFLYSFTIIPDLDCDIKILPFGKWEITGDFATQIPNLKYDNVEITCNSITKIQIFASTGINTLKVVPAHHTNKIGLVRSSSTANFESAIAQNAIENETIMLSNINDLRSYIIIKHISMQSVQQLNYRLWFWVNSAYNSTFDATFFSAYMDFDLTSYGVQIGDTGTYYLDVSGLNMVYYDSEAVTDEVFQMHIGLQNLSTTSKNAGASGKVRLDIAYEKRVSQDV